MISRGGIARGESSRSPSLGRGSISQRQQVRSNESTGQSGILGTDLIVGR